MSTLLTNPLFYAAIFLGGVMCGGILGWFCGRADGYDDAMDDALNATDDECRTCRHLRGERCTNPNAHHDIGDCGHDEGCMGWEREDLTAPRRGAHGAETAEATAANLRPEVTR